MTRSLGTRRYLNELRNRVSGRLPKPEAKYTCACGETFSCRHKIAQHERDTGHRRLDSDT